MFSSAVRPRPESEETENTPSLAGFDDYFAFARRHRDRTPGTGSATELQFVPGLLTGVKELLPGRRRKSTGGRPNGAAGGSSRIGVSPLRPPAYVLRPREHVRQSRAPEAGGRAVRRRSRGPTGRQEREPSSGPLRYAGDMSAPSRVSRPRGLAQLVHWPRVRFTLAVSTLFGLLLGLDWETGVWSVLSRTLLLGLVAMLVFGVFEQWPRRLPRRLARWVLQVVGVAVAMPITTALLYAASTPPGAPPFYADRDRMAGFSTLSSLSLLVVPWLALGALVRQKEALAREQALAFDLEKSELERQALDARLRLLQAQVAPHFLFNTLANVQALVDAGSPRASAVLQNLIAYLRAAVPRINEPGTTIQQEVDLAGAYLELMHMRMPDRLQFAVHVDDAARPLLCPPMMLLTLVENAVRHGVDPSEEGGRIDITVHRRGSRCLVRISDTGVGLGNGAGGLGTGLSTLRERLALAFGEDFTLAVSGQSPRGVSAEIDIPARVWPP